MTSSNIDSYNYFIAKERELAIMFSGKLHEAYLVMNGIYNKINKHRAYLQFIGFPIHILDKGYNKESKSVLTLYDKHFDDTVEHIQLKANISALTTMYHSVIPTYQTKLAIHSINSSMAYTTYCDIINTINQEIANVVLLGKRFSFRKKIGLLRIHTFNRNFNRKVVDKGETNKLKKQGINKIVYHVDDTYVGFKLIRNPESELDVRFYAFTPTNFVNTKDRSKSNFIKNSTSVNEVLRSTKVGNLTKMLAIKKIKGNNFYPNPNDLQLYK
jgi:hypothetical protein